MSWFAIYAKLVIFSVDFICWSLKAISYYKFINWLLCLLSHKPLCGRCLSVCPMNLVVINFDSWLLVKYKLNSDKHLFYSSVLKLTTDVQPRKRRRKKHHFTLFVRTKIYKIVEKRCDRYHWTGNWVFCPDMNDIFDIGVRMRRHVLIFILQMYTFTFDILIELLW